MIVLLIAATLHGGGCQVVVRAANHHVAAQQIVHAAPVYSAPYYAASALAYKVEDPERAALVRSNEKMVDALIGELNAQRQRVAALEASAPEGPQRLPVNATTILNTHCASCHSGAKAKGEFALSAKPNAAERILINSMVNGDKPSMPPKDRPQLTAEERKAIETWAEVSRSELKAAAKAAK